MTAPSSPSRKFEELLMQLVARVDALETGGRSAQLGASSIDDGYIAVRAGGATVSTWGVQGDGTVATANFNKVPPPKPNTPFVTGLIAGVDVGWNGELIGAKPKDFSHCLVYVSPVEGFIPGESNLAGTLFRAGSLPVAPLETVPYYVRLVAVNTSGTESEPSFEERATPRQVVADQVLDGIVDELALADSAVSAAKLAAAAVTTTKIANDAVTTPKLVAGAVQTDKIATGAVQADNIAADAVTADKLSALAVTADKIDANAITAGKIDVGAVTASKLETNLSLQSRLIAGNPTGTRVELSESGMIVVRANGDTTFSVDSSTGDVVSMGQYYTSRSGERIAMNSGGISSPSIRAYPDRGSYYASLFARSAGTADKRVAFWGLRVPYVQSAGVVGFAEFVAEDSTTHADILSSKLWYRPYINSQNQVIPGWEAFHQDVAITFSEGWMFCRNRENTAAASMSVKDLYSTGGLRTGAVYSNAYDGAIRWSTTGNLESVTGNGAAYRGVVASAYGNGPASWRHLKTGFRSLTDYLGESPLQTIDDLDIQAFSYREDAGEGLTGTGEHIGPMLDEMPEPLIDRRTNDAGEDRSSWELKSLLTVSLGAIQELSKQVTELTARVRELEGSVAA